MLSYDRLCPSEATPTDTYSFQFYDVYYAHFGCYYLHVYPDGLDNPEYNLMSTFECMYTVYFCPSFKWWNNFKLDNGSVQIGNRLHESPNSNTLKARNLNTLTTLSYILKSKPSTNFNCVRVLNTCFQRGIKICIWRYMGGIRKMTYCVLVPKIVKYRHHGTYFHQFKIGIKFHITIT